MKAEKDAVHLPYTSLTLFFGTLLYGDSMQVPILWHVRVYVHSSTLLHACIYVSTKWLLEVRSDYVCCKVHWLLLHWYC